MKKLTRRILLIKLLKWETFKMPSIGGQRLTAEGLDKANETIDWIMDGSVWEIPLRYQLAKRAGANFCRQAWEHIPKK